MKNLFPSFAKVAAVALCALTFGSCNRAEYAILPQGASYHGVTRAATPVPAKPAAVASTETAAVAQPSAEEVVPVAAPAAAEVAVASDNAPATAAKVATSKPAAAANTAVATATPAAAATTVASEAPQAKGLTKIMTRKIEKRVAKLISKLPSADRQNMASTAKGGVSGNLRLGIILMVIGALIALLPGLFRVLGLIVFIVGVLFLLLWVLDQA